MVVIDLSTRIRAPLERCFDLACSIEVHLSGTEGTGESVVDGVKTGLVGPGDFVRWRAKHLGVWQHLTSKITAYDRPNSFQDTMLKGAFRSMQHDHLFTSHGEDDTEMVDHFAFSAPIPVIGRIVEMLFLERYMTSFLEKRNAVLKRIAESDDWQKYLSNSA